MAENVALKLAPVLDGIEGEGDFPEDHVMSASEGEVEADSDGETRHENLLKAIASLSSKEKKKKAPRQRSEPNKEVSEFHFSTITDTDQQVGLPDLIGSLQKSAEHGVLKKELASMQNKSGPLDVPLPTPEVQKIQRTVAFDETSKDINKWGPIVTKNREAEHLSFPLKPYQPDFPSLRGLAVNFKPRTPLEEEVAAVLRGSSSVLERRNKELSKQDEEALLAMDLEEARNRRHELQKLRALQSYYEAKCHRIRKIKSKKYHRIKRRDENRAAEKMTKGELQSQDPELAKEILEKAERLRAMERASLKHRNTSKWARQLAKRLKNPDAKKLLQDQLRMSQTLTQKTEQAASDEEMESPEQGQGMNDDVVELETYGKLLTSEDNPWRLETNEKEHSQEITSTLDCDSSSKLYRPQPVTAQETSVEGDKESEPSDSEGDESEEEFELQPVSHVEKKNEKEGPNSKAKKAANRTEKKKKRKSDLIDGDNTNLPSKKSKKMAKTSKRSVKTSAKSDEQAQNVGQIGKKQDPVKKRETKNIKQKKAGEAMTLDEVQKVVAGSDISKEENCNSLTMHDTTRTKTKDICVDPKKVFQIEDSGTDLDKESGNSLQQKRIDIQQAFANDDVVEEFVQEKNEIEEASKTKDIDLGLPGWGSWAGAGLRSSEKKKKAIIKKADPTPPRKEKGLPHVIINENKNIWLAKNQVSSVPHPFGSHLQFERSMRNPIGKHWNTSTTVSKLIKPRVSTLIGTIIEPIQATKEIKQNKSADRKGQTEGQESSGIAIHN